MAEMILHCTCCGCQCVLPDGLNLLTCPACGTQNARPAAKGESLELLQRAIDQRRAGDFVNAEASYQRVLGYYPREHEALWGLLLCRYGVEYVKDPATGQYMPTVHTVHPTPLRANQEFEAACQNAPEDVRAQYMRDGAYIDKAQERVRELAKKCPAYDVFLCHKTTKAGTKENTQDFVRAQDLYHLLKGKGYRVFFAPISLRNAAGANYEAGIYHALHTARVMLLVCSSEEHLMSPWVQSEWSRFLKLMDVDTERRLAPLLYDQFDPAKLPQQLAYRNLQGLDIGQLNAKDDLLGLVKEAVADNGPQRRFRALWIALAVAAALLMLVVWQPWTAETDDAPQELAARSGEEAADAEATLKAAEEEAARITADAEAAVNAAKEEAARITADAEAAQKAAEEEAARITAGAEAAQKAAEEEAARITADAEAAQKAAEEETARKADAEAAVKAAEEEAARILADAEAAVKAAEEEAARITSDAEATLKAAEEEAARITADAEAAQKAVEEEAARITADAEATQAANKNVALPTSAGEPTPAPTEKIDQQQLTGAENAAARRAAEAEAAKQEQARKEEEARKAAEEAEAALRAKYPVGSSVTYGELNGKALTWQVLTVEDGKALLLAEYAVAQMPYNSTKSSVTWSNCTLHTWLNNDLYNTAFNTEERAFIAKTLVEAEANDYLFLLSAGEVKEYLPGEDLNRVCYNADWEPTGWWLRTSGSSTLYAAGVSPSGSVGEGSHIDLAAADYAVRPALWLDVRAIEEDAARKAAEEAAWRAQFIEGNTVTFGEYNGQALTWQVLKVENGQALLLAEKSVADKAYNTEYVAITWEKCTLRKWLNEDFLKGAFTDSERKLIAKTRVKAEANPSYPNVPAGNDADDYLFLLSVNEVKEYLPTADDRICCDSTGEGEWWWLRSPGGMTHSAAGVSSSGAVVAGGGGVSLGYAVRPAFWLNLGS